MKTYRWIISVLAAAAACASPGSRIKKSQAVFDAYPPAVQADIRAGKADVGFTRKQVELALGRPDRKYVRKTSSVDEDVWAYGSHSVRPSLNLGFGMWSHGGGDAYSGGLGMQRSQDLEDRARVVFQGDLVVAVEARTQ